MMENRSESKPFISDGKSIVSALHDRVLEKATLRPILKKRRDSLSEERRALAGKKLLSLLSSLQNYPFILSFSSFRNEIDTHELNHILAQEKRLLLPRMNGDSLHLYAVHDLALDLIALPSGLKEPNPDRCPEVSLQRVSLALVPALGFDRSHYRLGYGKGCYDRLLSLASFPTWGIGYQEQLVEKLPKDPHDVKLSSLFLF